MKNKIVITIARDYGSGGKTVGQMLAKELNIPFYDREILYMASDGSESLPGVFVKESETSIECCAAPYFHGIVADIVK